MKTKRFHLKNLLIVPLAAMFWLAAPVTAQSTGDRDRDRDRDPTTNPPQDRTSAPPQTRDHDTTRAELANFDRFLDSHPEIAEQLRKDPSLADNREYLQNHPELQEFLQNHPGVREEMKENPNAFMRREDRYDRTEDGRDGDNRKDDADNRKDKDKDKDNDTTRRELANFDHFMDSHPEIAEQLRKDPSLVDNREFVEQHPALRAYLKDHPAVREEIKENPNAFMHKEEKYDRTENRHDGDMHGDQDRDRHRTSASFHEFLGAHSAISAQVSKDPSLLKNQEYLGSHPELQEYLKAHPDAQAQLQANADSFMKSSQQPGEQPGKNSQVKTPTPDPKGKE
jgi:phage-related protein